MYDMKKPFLKFNLLGFGLADEHPFELSRKEVENLIEIQQIDKHCPGELYEHILWAVDLFQKNESDLAKMLLLKLRNEIKVTI